MSVDPIPTGFHTVTPYLIIRSATVKDPYGHVWTIATHQEDVSPEELERRAAALHGD